MHRTISARCPRQVVRRIRGLVVALVGFGLASCTDDQPGPTSPSTEAPNVAGTRNQGPDVGPILLAHRRHIESLMELPGVVGTAVGLGADGRPAIKVFAADARARGMPASLEGFPVEVQVTGRFLADPCTPTTCTNTEAWPLPVPIGVSTGSNAFLAGTCYSGTIGARVKAGTSVYALSNNHVYALGNTVPLGTAVFQPGLGDLGCSTTTANNLGTLFRYAPIAFCGGSCPNNSFDAAIAISSTAKLDRKTPPAGYGTPNSVVWGPITLGAPVKKYGRTTSLTSGIVTGINGVVTVSYPNGNARFSQQIFVSSCGASCSKPGDSGSLWVSNDATANPIGLHFAGNGTTLAVASPLGPVLSYFGVTLDGNPARATASGSYNANCGFSCSNPRITVITASSNKITVKGTAGTGTITLTGATATGGLTANCGVTCGSAAITAITASGGNTIQLKDNGGHTGTITLSGTTAIRGLTASCVGICGPSRIISLSASGINGIIIGDNQSHEDYLKFQ